MVSAGSEFPMGVPPPCCSSANAACAAGLSEMGGAPSGGEMTGAAVAGVGTGAGAGGGGAAPAAEGGGGGAAAGPLAVGIDGAFLADGGTDACRNANSGGSF